MRLINEKCMVDEWQKARYTHLTYYDTLRTEAFYVLFFLQGMTN